MPLNCKPGELARIIDNAETRRTGLVDKIVRVTSIVLADVWRYEGPSLRCACCGIPVIGVGDVLLRPIGNPPDDAADETLAWCPQPEQLEAMS